MDSIEMLLTRGVEKIYPSKEALEKVLKSGKKLRVYQGFDPTSPQLHIGHMVGLRKLRQWQDLGHHVIFLIGDFTAMVGDPSGKYSARKIMTHEQTLKNAKTYKEQAAKILNFEGDNPAEILFNGSWLGKISAIEFLRIAGNLTYNQVVERDMFQERIKQGQNVYINELLYPVMQAYDSVAMNVDLEIGGSDQTFNMLMGRHLMQKMKGKEKFVLTTPLMTDSTGKKIGKTESNVIALQAEPKNLFGMIMSLTDDVIIKGLEYLTDVPMEKIRSIKQKIKTGENPMQFKKLLAFEIVKSLNSQKEAQEAQTFFEQAYQKQGVNLTNLHIVKVDSQSTIMSCLTNNFKMSKSEVKRLIEQKAIDVNDQTITDFDLVLNAGDIVRVGKHRIFRVG